MTDCRQCKNLTWRLFERDARLDEALFQRDCRLDEALEEIKRLESQLAETKELLEKYKDRSEGA